MPHAKRPTDIVNSTALTSKRLIRAMEFISAQPELKILHKPGKFHVVPDALSRLPTTNNLTKPEEPGGLDRLPYDREEHWALALPRIQAPPDGPTTGDIRGYNGAIASTTFRPKGHPGGDGGEADSSGTPKEARKHKDDWPLSFC
jgi:hypothetical protein